MKEARLYAIIDLGYVNPENASQITQSLILGGADVIQLRAKQHPITTIRTVAAALIPICQAANIPFILNDHPDLAAELYADGVHIGQDDGSLANARSIIGPNKIIGRSTHSFAQAQDALAEGFDYIGFGPLFPTPTKAGRPGIGMEHISIMESEIGSKIPAFCIGGIKRSLLPSVLAAGAKRVCMVSDLLTAPDVTAATREATQMLA